MQREESIGKFAKTLLCWFGKNYCGTSCSNLSAALVLVILAIKTIIKEAPVEACSSQASNAGSLIDAMFREVHLVVSNFSSLGLGHHLVTPGRHLCQHPRLIEAIFWMRIHKFFKLHSFMDVCPFYSFFEMDTDIIVQHTLFI